MPQTPGMLGLDIPNFLPDSVFGVNLDWAQPAGRLIWSTLIVVVATVAIVIWSKVPKSPEPVTWAGAMLGAIAVFGLMIVAYGVWPHEWLTYANSYLNWGKDSFLLHQNSVLPFDITMRVVADSIATVIYGIAVTINVFLFVIWQKRPVREPETVADEPESRSESRTSAYGRPVTTSG